MAEVQTAEWRNWADTFRVTPTRTARPRSADEVADEVRRAAEDNLSIKAIGSGHSFNDIGITRGVLLYLDRLTGILSADRSTGLVTVGAGTRLDELSPALWELGLALSNLGDVDVQTISGAISTGTHGTGRSYGGLSTQVHSLQLVLADGTIAECSEQQRPELFQCARLGLGALGIITAVTLQCVPAFALHALERPDRLDAVLAELDDIVAMNDHFEFYWFPHTERVMTKTNERLPGDSPLHPVGRVRGWLADDLLANGAFERVNRVTARRPGLTPLASKVAARALGSREFTDRSYRVFASAREVRFREMEYAVEVGAVGELLRGIAAWVEQTGEFVSFPVEVRFSPADEIPLSPSQGRTTGWVAVHQYHRRAYEPYFDAVEQLARGLGGRPHWGKLHWRSAADLAPSYPRFEEFVRLRQDVDPERRFANDYLRRVLGA